ncbi:MAG: hypothetical protein GC154_01995 [bacterium]|nr:hypothetical protein [bacterium]
MNSGWSVYIALIHASRLAGFILLTALYAHGMGLENWRFWREENGLKESYCQQVFMAPSGVIFVRYWEIPWISRLDGYRVTHIQIPEETQLVSISESPDETLWLKSSEGLWRKDDETWTLFSVEPLDSNRWFAPLSRDRVLYAYQNNIYEYNTNSAASAPLLTSNRAALGPIRSMNPVSTREFIFGAQHGFYRVMLDENSETGISGVPLPENWSGLKNAYPQSDGGVICVVASPGAPGDQLAYYDGERFESLDYRADPLEALWPGGEGRDVWAFHAILHERAVHSERGELSMTFDSDSVLTGDVMDTVHAPDGSFWLAMSQGLARWSSSIWRTPKESPFQNSLVFDIHQDDAGRLWFAGMKGLASLEDGKWSYFPYPSGTVPRHTYPDTLGTLRDGSVVLQTLDTSRILRFDPQTETYSFIIPPSEKSIGHLFYQGGGLYWIYLLGENGGEFVQYDGDRFTPLKGMERIPDLGELRSLYKASDGSIWITGLEGFLVIRDGTIQRNSVMDESGEQGALTILEISPDTVWFGGRQHVYQWRKGVWSRVLSHVDRARSMLIDHDGVIWTASGAGLQRFQNNCWAVHSRMEGLPSAVTYKVFEDREGRIWCGAANGVSLYYPETDVRAPETMVNASDNPSVVSPEGDVRLVFTGRDFWDATPPDRLYFSHRLDGEDWTPYSAQSAVEYRGLRSGEHVLNVRAMDRNGNVDSSPAEFRFSVLPPWHQSPVFLAMTALSSLLALALAVLLIRRHLWMAELVDSRTLELSQANRRLEANAVELRKLAADVSLAEERERRLIATDLHDRIGQALAMCQLRLDLILSRIAPEGLKKPLSDICALIENTNQATRSLVFEISPPSLYELNLESALEQLTVQMERQYPEIHFEFEDEGSDKPLEGDVRYLIYRAARELVTNVIKHSKARHAKVSVAADGDSISVSVIDDGVGLPPRETRGDGFGLYSIQERLHQIGGRLEIESEPHRKTCVTIIAPLVRTGARKREHHNE